MSWCPADSGDSGGRLRTGRSPALSRRERRFRFEARGAADAHRARTLLRATCSAAASLLLGLRAAAEAAGARLRSRTCPLEGEAGAGVHHRRALGVDGRDDFLGVDPL